MSAVSMRISSSGLDDLRVTHRVIDKLHVREGRADLAMAGR